jgi:hypothetical protein
MSGANANNDANNVAPIQAGPELDDMFARGMTGLTMGGVLAGSAMGAANMVPPAMAPALAAAADFTLASTALRVADNALGGPQQQRQPVNNPVLNGPAPPASSSYS